MNLRFADADIFVVGVEVTGYCEEIEDSTHGALIWLHECKSRVRGNFVRRVGSFAFAGTARQIAVNLEDSARLIPNELWEVRGVGNVSALIDVYAKHQLQAYSIGCT